MERSVFVQWTIWLPVSGTKWTMGQVTCQVTTGFSEQNGHQLAKQKSNKKWQKFAVFYRKKWEETKLPNSLVCTVFLSKKSVWVKQKFTNAQQQRNTRNSSKVPLYSATLVRTRKLSAQLLTTGRTGITSEFHFRLIYRRIIFLPVTQRPGSIPEMWSLNDNLNITCWWIQHFLAPHLSGVERCTCPCTSRCTTSFPTTHNQPGNTHPTLLYHCPTLPTRVSDSCSWFASSTLSQAFRGTSAPHCAHPSNHTPLYPPCPLHVPQPPPHIANPPYSPHNPPVFQTAAVGWPVPLSQASRGISGPQNASPDLRAGRH